MDRERMMAISTDEYKQLAEIKIRAGLLWEKCARIKHEEGAATISIDEVQFLLNAEDNYDPFCGLPMQDVPQQGQYQAPNNFTDVMDGRN